MQRIDEAIYSIFQTEFVSPIEAAMHWAFRDIGVNVDRQIGVGKYRVDFLLGKTIIECDGKEFHDAKYDYRRDLYCAEQGYRIVRIPYHSINRHYREIAAYLVWRYESEQATELIVKTIPWEIDYNCFVRVFVYCNKRGYYQNLFVKRDR